MTFWIRSLPLLALIAVLAPIASHASPNYYLCGRQLVDSLNLICGDRGFYWGPRERRNIEESLARGMEALSFQPQDKRGIVEECCVNICPLHVLENYCN
ncbi:PREDICTED: insulin-like [Gekko japonicus]|uniref:Insulin n=1 Tax=Gekko japonicus TaxID=146911 RepID=A0A0M5MRX6_GEKJA|nr:PREDICTED: insulin-like [Gekko japonicus]BAS32697.1 insulin [Gekko japonicus]